MTTESESLLIEEELAGFIHSRTPSGLPYEECWEWMGGRQRDDYGSLRWKGASLLAHRVAYEIYFPALRPGEVVRHRCDNPPCVNPHHLEAGTQADNVQDCISRGRMALGERRGAARLNRDQVAEARHRYSQGESALSMSAEYGVHHATLTQAIHGQTWGWLPGAVPPKPHRTWSESDINSMRDRLSGGESVSSVARSLGVDRGVVRRAVAKVAGGVKQ